MMFNRRTVILKAVLLAFTMTLFNCSGSKQSAKRVILLGIDALSTDGLQTARTPNLDRLIRDGALSLKARGVMPTVSSPNWGSMLTGAGPEQHGITSNGWLVDNFTIEATEKDSAGYFPSIFKVIREQMPQARQAAFFDWAGLGNLFNHNYLDKLEITSGYVETYDRAIPYIITEKPDFCFVYVGHPDEEGHARGHGTPAYYKSIEDVDTQIGRLLEALDKNGLYEESHILVISDHGGVGFGHGGESMAEIQVPWLIRGPGIRTNHLIRQAINTFDTAPTIARLFNLQLPDCWIGRPVQAAFSGQDGGEQEGNEYVAKPKSSLSSGIYTQDQKLTFRPSDQEAVIRYTTDGSQPTTAAQVYRDEILLDHSMTVKAAAFRGSSVSQTEVVEFMKVSGVRNVHLRYPPSPKYPGGGALGLVDGKRGGADYRDSAWLGFEYNDLEALIDLGELKIVHKISLECLESTASWIFYPRRVEISAGRNKSTLKPLGTLSSAQIAAAEGHGVKLLSLDAGGRPARFIKIVATNQGTCPPGHPGAGGKAWLFADEIMIE